MTNKYYASPVDLAPGTKARAGDINTIDQSIDAAFDKLPDEVALKSGTVNYAVNKSAAANAYVVDLAAAVTAYADGLEVKLKPGSDNTGACTLNVNGLGAIAIKRQDGTDAVAGDLLGASPITLVYSAGSNSFRLPPLANAQVTAAAASAAAAAASAAAAAGSASTASGQAQLATSARTAADAAAGAAVSAATAAGQSYSSARDSASSAAGSAQAAATSAQSLAAAVTSASTSAGNASTSAGAAAGSASAAATSAGQASGSASAASTSATAAATSAGQAAASANAAAQTAASVQTSVSAAASSAQQASAARDAAIVAWQASTAPTEQLAAISKQFHQGAVVDVFLYDTSRDSDGGAWRKRCKHTSWENETLVPGKWQGYQAGDDNAIAARGVVAGDYFQAQDGKFYRFGVGEVFRGNTREFPALALIVAEASRVVIYDATKPELPMWFVIQLCGGFGLWQAYGIGSITALNGIVAMGTPVTSSVENLRLLNFIADNAYTYCSNGSYYVTYGGRNGKWPFGLARRHDPTLQNLGDSINAPALVSAGVNDVAMTVLADAPIDPATGLPVPTLYASTAAGVSRIAHDGTISSTASSSGSGQIWIDAPYVRALAQKPYGVACSWPLAQVLPAGSSQAGNHLNTYWSSSAYYSGLNLSIFSNNSCGVKTAIGGTKGLSLIKENPSALSKGMLALITAAYNSGWMVGDTRGAWLADTVAEVIASAELVTNGTFNSDVTGWTAANGATLSLDTNRLKVTNSGAATSNGYAWQAINTVPGKTYKFSVDFSNGGSSTGFYIYAGTSVGDGNLGAFSSALASGTLSLTFTATGATTYISLIIDSASNHFGYFDNATVKLASLDRSNKANSLAFSGSITKAPVAAGAQLVGYSGWSTANYLEQAYNSDLDFGTGDFCIMGWGSAGGVVTNLYNRADPAGSASNRLLVQWASNLTIYGGVGSYAMVLDAQNVIPASGMCFVAAVRRSGVLEAWVNGKMVASTAFTQDLNNSLATLRIGGAHAGVGMGVGSLALVRASATAPSADQLAQIYRDELALFQPGAQCVIAGDLTQTVDSLAYDDATELLHVGTNWGYRSAFHGLVRVESEWVGNQGGAGGVNALSATGGCVFIGGTAASRYSQPAVTLREELRRKYEARQAMAREEIPLDFDGTAGVTAYQLPIGFNVKNVFVAGTKKRIGSTKDYTVSYDGYRQTVNFGVSPGATWVQITANRSI